MGVIYSLDPIHYMSDLQWSTVIYSDLQWSTVIYSDLQWSTVIYSSGEGIDQLQLSHEARSLFGHKLPSVLAPSTKPCPSKLSSAHPQKGQRLKWNHPPALLMLMSCQEGREPEMSGWLSMGMYIHVIMNVYKYIYICIQSNINNYTPI